MLKRLLGISVLGLAMALPVFADDKKPTKPEEKKPAEAPKGGDAKPAAPGAPDTAAMMAMYEEAAKLGPQHEAMKPLLGSWKTANKMWMDPSAPPMVSQGTMERKVILGGRFMHEEYSGTMMDKPFNGIGHMGYDNMEKKYVATWIDSMGTGIMTMSGQADASGKVFTMTSDRPDPFSGMKMKTVVKIVNNDKHTFEMFMIGSDGKEMKNMEMECTRK